MGNMDLTECRKTQAAYDNCVHKNLDLQRPHYGYHCLPKIHETDRHKPVEEKPGWMNNDKAKKLGELPKDFQELTRAGDLQEFITQTWEIFRICSDLISLYTS